MLRKVVWIGIVVVFIRGLVFGQGVPYGVEFRVNTYTEGDQSNPCITSLSDGRFVVCWESYGQDGSGAGIYGQIFASSGEKIGDEFQINNFTLDDQTRPCVKSLSNGDFVVCWEGWNRESGYEIYGRIFSSGGRVGNEFMINPDESGGHQGGYQWYPCVCSLSDGRFIVSWISVYQGLYGQIFSSTGNKIGNSFQVNIGWNYESNPCIIGLSDNKFVICWTAGLGADPWTGNKIKCQIFSSNGIKFGKEFQVNTFTGYQSNPTIASIPDSGFIVCWQSDLQDSCDWEIYGQFFSLSGKKIGDEFKVNTYTSGDQLAPCISLLPDRKILVCWESAPTCPKFGIYGQIFSFNGERIWKEFRVNPYAEGWQKAPCITSLPDGGFVVCWQSPDGSGDGIYAKRFPSSPRVHTLKSFRLLEPSNDSSLRTTYANLRWQQPSEQIVCYSWELQYKIYLDDNSDFTSPEIYEQDMDTMLMVQNLKPGSTYFWKVLAKNIAGDSVWSSDVFGFYVRPDVGVEEISKKPDAFSLDQNYPNPFNASTEIRYELPVSGHVTVAIYDIKGRLVRVLVQGVEEAGSHSIVWDGKDALGKDVPSGIYLYKLSFKDKEGRVTVITRKMGLVR